MNSSEGAAQAHSTADAVARRSYGKLVALLAARTGDIAAAEDALSEAFVKALVDWPLNGCPSNPEAWLLSVARRKIIDMARRRRTHELVIEQLQLRVEWFDPATGDIGRYQFEAALQSAHVYRRRTGQANWSAVVQLYDALLALSGSPVVAINRALAIAELYGPIAAPQAIKAIAADSRLTEYQPYWAARAELLAKTGTNGEAYHSYEIAIGLERDSAVRRCLQRRQLALMW